MLSANCLSAEFRDEILTWEYSGFSVDASVRVEKGDRAKMRRLIRYMARPPISQERLRYDPKTGEAHVFSTKKWLGQRKWVATYDAMEFLALLSLQVPPRGTHMIRYFGAYSVRARAIRRGKEATRKGESAARPSIEEMDSPGIRERKQRWAQLIRYVFEVDPLKCTNCGAQMKIISFITNAQSNVIDQILEHLEKERTELKATGPPAWLRAREEIDRGPSDEFYLTDPIFEEPVWQST